VSLSLAHLIALAAPPAAIVLRGSRLAPRSKPALFVTVLATWLFATVALSWLLPDPSDISAFYLFFLVVVPGMTIPVAALVATRMVRIRGRLVSAVVLSSVGWIVGLVVGLIVGSLGSPHAAIELPYYFWMYALDLALPATYAACAAIVAAGLAERIG
jgi:hypothetical protein